MNEPATVPSIFPPILRHVVSLFVGDVCVATDDEADIRRYCEVERTVLDVEYHDPYPQDEYDTEIQRHRRVPRKQFSLFMKTGRPPTGTVLVKWLDQEVVLLPETELGLVYRHIRRGQEVKLRDRPDMTGIVIGKHCRYDIKPSLSGRPEPAFAETFKAMSSTVMNLFGAREANGQWADGLTSWTARTIVPGSQQNQGNQQNSTGPTSAKEASSLKKRLATLRALPISCASRDSDVIFYNIPRDYLHTPITPPENSVIVSNGWIGVVYNADDLLTIELDDGCIVEVLDDDAVVYLDEEDSRYRLLEVRVHLSNLPRSTGTNCRRKGEAHHDRHGRITQRKALNLHVEWLGYCSDTDDRMRPEMPPPTLSYDSLQTGTAKILTGSKEATAEHQIFKHSTHEDLIFGQFAQVVPGQLSELQRILQAHVSDLTAGAHKDSIAANVEKIITTNDFGIYSQDSGCIVRWQDGTEAIHISEELEEVIDFTDENGFQPGDIVIPQYQASQTDEHSWRPDKIGVIQSTQSADRVSQVLWQKTTNLTFILPISGGMFLHGDSTTGLPAVRGSGWLEDTPVYDLMPFPQEQHSRLGDYVTVAWPKLARIAVLHQSTNSTSGGCTCDVCYIHQSDEATRTSWIGQIMDNRHDGMTIVRFVAIDPVQDRALPLEAYTFALSMAAYEENLDEEEARAHAADHDDMNMDVDLDSDDEDDAIETWVENEDGERMDTTGEGYKDAGWDTVSEASSGHDLDKTTTDAAAQILDKAGTSIHDDSTVSTQTHKAEYPAHARKVPKLSATSAPESYLLLDTPPPDDHHFLLEDTEATTTARTKRIFKEHSILSASLPEGVFVRAWESRLDLLRILMVGPVGTPYEFCPFVFDLQLGAGFPDDPPKAHFYSWTRGSGRINPNLYEEGKICLSLLNTWPGERRSEGWDSVKSTVLQVIVSLLGLVLVREPYYNEAGYDTRSGSAESAPKSQHYSEKAFYSCRGFIKHALENDVVPFHEILQWLYTSTQADSPQLLTHVIEDLQTVVDDTSVLQHLQIGGLSTMSKGATIVLRRRLLELEELRRAQTKSKT